MRYISTTDTNITFTDVDGKVMVVPKNRVYTHFNVDTVTFLLIERYDNEGICIFTTIAEDLQINGTTYTYEQLLDGEGISDLFSPTGLSFEVVEELPETGSDGVIYLVPNGENSYIEYLWIANEQRYEILGDVGDIDLTDYYTKTQVDEKLDLKANASDVYTKTEADNKFLTEHQSLDNYYTKDDVYNKTESDAKYATQVVVNEEIASRIAGDGELNTALQAKADKSDTYTKSQVDDALALKQDASTAFSGDYNDLSNKPTIPTVPTNVSAFTNDAGYLTEHQSLDNYYTKNEVDTELADKQDTLTAGANITIENNVISSTGGTQVQADWNQTDDTAVDYIKNKPAIPDTSDFVNKSEYNPKEVAIAEALIDLNENKADKTELPDVSTFATKTELNAKQDALVSGTNIKTINNQSILGEGNIEIQGGGGAYYISFATIATTGITDEDWDGIVAAIDAHRPIYAGYPKNDGGILYYGVECMNKNGNNTQIILTSSDDSSHYFYTFTKNGSNDYSYTVETRPYTTAAEKTAWNAKANASDVYTKSEIDAMVGNINTILASI